ncbi:helicase [Pseudomonas sp. FSL R10-0056]|uniref:Cysteine-rich CWC family protein n=2 Tax=Pseudomonas TaxID=286 RepID=A0ABT4WR16_PSEFR|nr:MULTISPECIES: cysteine-rich CWC family protein [Pseudomonas]MBO4967961.1 cysteine-rich CWC family protein [Pseudomonas sp.]MBO6277948.1 cysteine-rich CWC family protein [Pseudomonas sp.]MBP3362232.1 cysteine-rich CWC family protein [Pseudomonas sp.]MBP3860292.1 cysteine-rich CWC family protein [Pseudomonas sp.]MBP3934042.1 cysteine-rich CWC family protein [Pseudomonas sp.]
MTTPDLCPACGARNDCSMASPDIAAQSCWCHTVNIDPKVIQALPLELRDLACLCPRCANVASQLPPARAQSLT